MQIAKYLLLLLLLSFIATSIYIATSKGEFTVEKSRIINSKISTVFSFANELRNWKDWNSLVVEDSLISIKYSENTIGKGTFCNWNGKEWAGDIKIIDQKENETILQTINFNGNSADVLMVFKDTLGKTKVTIKAKGKMSFTSKFSTIFNSIDYSFGMIFEKSLTNLDNKLDYEINTHSVKVNGLVRKLQTFYLSQTLTSEFLKVGKNSSIVFSKITAFCKNNDLTIKGKPFIIYHTYDTTNKLTKISICIPIQNSILTSEGSEILSDTLHSFNAIKTTLLGDYSHKEKALNKTLEHFKANKLNPDTKFSHLEIYTIGRKETNKPSKWLTEIYYPIKPKVVNKPRIVSKPIEVQMPKTEQENEIPSEF